MKGKITLQPLREEKLNTKGWYAFSKEEAVHGLIDRIEGDTMHFQDGDSIPVKDAYEFMVKGSSPGEMYSLCKNNIDETMDNDWWDYYDDAKELEFEIDGETATVVVNPVEMGATQRGFSHGEFTDQYEAKCSIQASSLATKACIWLGVDDPDPQIMASDAIKMGMDTSGQTTGWVKYPIPKEVLLSTRMHLSREDVKKMLPLLTKFAETGEL